jgi:hypothetical protein
MASSDCQGGKGGGRLKLQHGLSTGVLGQSSICAGDLNDTKGVFSVSSLTCLDHVPLCPLTCLDQAPGKKPVFATELGCVRKGCGDAELDIDPTLDLRPDGCDTQGGLAKSVSGRGGCLGGPAEFLELSSGRSASALVHSSRTGKGDDLSGLPTLTSGVSVLSKADITSESESS